MAIETPFSDINHSWSGVGGVFLSQTGCVFSSTANSSGGGNGKGNGNGGGNPQPYALEISSVEPAFALRKDSELLPVSFSATDSAGQVHPLVVGQSATLANDGICNNVTLTLTVNETDILSVPAGTYSTAFTVTVQEGGDSASQSLVVTIAIPSRVQISRLNDINLGVYSGGGIGVSYNEAFCVYANVPAYTLTPSSATIGAGPGSFALSSGSSVLEYRVSVDNSPSAMNGTALDNDQESPSMSADLTPPLATNCGGADNAAVYLEVTAAALDAAPVGNYTGTLTVRLAPL